MILSNKTMLGLAVLAAVGVAGVRPAAAGVVYSNDFSSNANGFSIQRLSTSPSGESFLGEFASDTPGAVPYGYQSDGINTWLTTDTLTLNGLAAHGTVTVSFDYYALKSMDGDGFGPDGFFLTGGATGTEHSIFSATFSNTSNAQSFGGPDGHGGYIVVPFGFGAQTGATKVNSLGYTFYGDSTYHLSFTFADSSPTLKLDWGFFCTQGINDESGGMDNVVVSTDASGVTPEPSQAAALGIGIFGLVGLIIAARRRNARNVSA
jgi:hypothetical protein